MSEPAPAGEYNQVGPVPNWFGGSHNEVPSEIDHDTRVGVTHIGRSPEVPQYWADRSQSSKVTGGAEVPPSLVSTVRSMGWKRLATLPVVGVLTFVAVNAWSHGTPAQASSSASRPVAARSATPSNTGAKASELALPDAARCDPSASAPDFGLAQRPDWGIGKVSCGFLGGIQRTAHATFAEQKKDAFTLSPVYSPATMKTYDDIFCIKVSGNLLRCTAKSAAAEESAMGGYVDISDVKNG